MMRDEWVLLLLLAAVVLPAAWVDFRQRRIPNEISLAGILLGVAFHLISHGVAGAGDAVLGLLLAFVIGFPLWLLGWMGAGDVKLVAAVGAIVGFSLVLPVLAGIAIAGGGVALVYLLWNRLQNEPLAVIMASALAGSRDGQERPAQAVLPDKIKKGIPYAIPVAFGSLATIVYLS
jgi:prepilin peptidase CpaA